MKEFDKVIGYEEVKKELNYVLDIMLNSEKYDKLGVKLPRGILLNGEPGVGKTLMATCFIEASKRKTFIIRKDKPDGDFITSITKSFEDAVANQPSIIFLDDMDKYENEDVFHANAEAYVTVQSCIDSVKDKDVFVLATTNDLDNLPKSLLRVGRFDKIIDVRNPKIKDAVKIIEHYLSKIKFVDNIDCEYIAKLMAGRSCAELETLINEAGVYAGYANKEKIDTDDIIKACMRVIFNAPESIDCTDEDLTLTAYHEAGHAVVSEVLEPNSVNIVSVLKHEGDIGGVTSYYQDESYFNRKKFMENRVLSLLAGKAATEVVFGEVDVGANSDLHRAFDIVTRFVDNYCSTSFDRWEISRDSSPALLERKEMQTFIEIEKYYQQAKKILIDNRKFLDGIANALVEKKTITNKDIIQIKNNI